MMDAGNGYRCHKRLLNWKACNGCRTEVPIPDCLMLSHERWLQVLALLLAAGALAAAWLVLHLVLSGGIGNPGFQQGCCS